jgi:hypothetical protein
MIHSAMLAPTCTSLERRVDLCVSRRRRRRSSFEILADLVSITVGERTDVSEEYNYSYSSNMNMDAVDCPETLGRIQTIIGGGGQQGHLAEAKYNFF